MAVNMISTNGQVRYHVDEYVIDTPDDLAAAESFLKQNSL